MKNEDKPLSLDCAKRQLFSLVQREHVSCSLEELFVKAKQKMKPSFWKKLKREHKITVLQALRELRLENRALFIRYRF